MKNQGENDKETEEDKMPRHEKHPPFRWVSIWGIFYFKVGDFLRFLTQAYPPGGVRAIYIYIYIYPPCPTYQLWPFSSANGNHPKMPVRDPQMNFPEFPGSTFFGMPRFPGIFRHFPGEAFVGGGVPEKELAGGGWRQTNP